MGPAAPRCHAPAGSDPRRNPPVKTISVSLRLSLVLLLAATWVVPQAAPSAEGARSLDLRPLWDTHRVLINPDKGWYHHYPDNHIDQYRIARDADLLEFPGMDHLYIRLAWAYLEPKEGQFDWAVIDRLIDKWTALGLDIAFRISCKETSTDRIEQQFATPRWVMAAGAQGGYYRMGKPTGPDGPWEPVFDDLIFLAKLDRFLAAFAARYDGKPWLRYVDIGSIGDWGEGHTWAGSQKEVGFEARKRHVDLHLKHFKRAQLVLSDDFVYALGNPTERQALHQYALSQGISYRDDSILVNGYLEGLSDRFTVRSPEFFADAYLKTPTVLELEHYRTVKRQGNWEGRPDSSVARFGKGKKGPDYFRGALELLHATYIGYHGDAREWLADNPELTGELLNRCGYWFFPKSVTLPRELVRGSPAELRLTWLNRGVAPAYTNYVATVILRLQSGGDEWSQPLPEARSRDWQPGNETTETYRIQVPHSIPPGDYALCLRLASATGRPIELGLREERRRPSGAYELTSVRLQ
jgi:hypothetical protein